MTVKYIGVEYMFSKPSNFRHSLIRSEYYETSRKIIKIEANSVERVKLNIDLPFYMTSDKRKCLDDQKDSSYSNNSYERCYYDKGQDLFGNKISYLNRLDGGGRMMLMPADKDMPKVRVRIKTGDGTTIEKIVGLSGFFPFNYKELKRVD